MYLQLKESFAVYLNEPVLFINLDRKSFLSKTGTLRGTLSGYGSD